MSQETPPRPLRTGNRRSLNAGDRLPTLELPAAPAGQPRRLRDASRNAVVLLLIPSEAEPWEDELDAIAGAAPEIEEWYARVRVVLADEMTDAQLLHDRLDGRVAVFSDPDARVATRVGLEADHAALVIVDRYGQIYEVTEAASAEELPDTAAIQQWTKFLATQCPECGVIDEPGHGEWAVG